MKPLYTDLEYNLAKSNDKLLCECYVCFNPFLKAKRDIKRVLNGTPKFSGKYCSRKCFGLSQNTKITFKCTWCKKSIVRTKKRITKNSFCSHSCAAKMTNTYANRRKNNFQYCSKCDRHISTKKIRLLPLCQKCTSEEKLKLWLEGNNNLKTKYGYSFLIKKYLLKKYDNKCQLCGFSGYNLKTKNSILQIDHIDGNWENSTISNVRLICPNCHAMTVNFGILNLGNGRKWKANYKTWSK